MLKKLSIVALVLVVGVGMSGCASINVAKGPDFNGQKISTQGEPVAHINGSCFGLYFLPFIPLITGDTQAPNTLLGCTFLEDTAQLPGVVEMVTRQSKTEGGTKAADMVSSSSSMWMFMTPFWWKTATVSASSIK